MLAEAEDIITTQEADAVADRLLGGGPTGDSDRVEAFFTKAAHTQGRGLGSSQDDTRQGRQQLLPTSALLKSLKRGRTRDASQHDDRTARASTSRADQQSSSDEDADKSSRDLTKLGHPAKGLTKQDLLAEHQAASGSSKRKRKRLKAGRQQGQLSPA